VATADAIATGAESARTKKIRLIISSGEEMLSVPKRTWRPANVLNEKGRRGGRLGGMLSVSIYEGLGDD
jgi:hypothetical protein